MSICIDLLARYGDRYVVDHARTGRPARPSDHPFYQGIPCLEQGDGSCHYVTPNGGDLLRLEVTGHPKVVRKLAALPGAERFRLPAGHDLVLFPSAVFEQAARIIKALKKSPRAESVPA